MACDSSTVEEIKTETKKEIEKMSSSLVLKKAPEFKTDAYDAKSGHYTTISSEDYKL